jgi:hypothetical protein
LVSIVPGHRQFSQGLSHVLPSSVIDTGAAIGQLEEEGGHIGLHVMPARGGIFEILIEDWLGSNHGSMKDN